MQVEMLTREDLQQLKTELLQELREVFSENRQPENRTWLKSAEVRKMLKISPGTLQNLRISGALPYTKVGGSLYYKYEDILKLLGEHKVELNRK